VPGHPYEQGFDLRLVPDKLTQPLLWRRPKMIFVNSMSDLFQEGVSDNYVEAVARVMTAAKWHTFQVLTKRSERLRDLLNTKIEFAAREAHIWWGVSVENRKHGLPRIEHLRQSCALQRFLSIEPLLEDLGTINLDDINWVIVGGESGPRARPMDIAWARCIRQQCEEARVAFFLKQLGGSKGKRGGEEALLDGRLWREQPARPDATP
jgi:protein gp37